MNHFIKITETTTRTAVISSRAESRQVAPAAWATTPREVEVLPVPVEATSVALEVEIPPEVVMAVLEAAPEVFF